MPVLGKFGSGCCERSCERQGQLLELGLGLSISLSPGPLNFGDSRKIMISSGFDLLLCKTESTIERSLRKEMGGQGENVE